MGILKDFDFSAFESADFKEDSVREEIIQPILNAIGYKATGNLKIVRSKKLPNSSVKIGSKKQKINHFPDYLLEVGGKPYFVLDAKGVKENILVGEHVDQVYFYAMHPDIRTTYYGLCNGKLFTVFHVSGRGEPLLVVNIADIDEKIADLTSYLLPSTSANISVQKPHNNYDYLSLKLLDEIKNIRKQSAKRHYGVHGYFTKQSWEIVQAYIIGTDLRNPQPALMI